MAFGAGSVADLAGLPKSTEEPISVGHCGLFLSGFGGTALFLLAGLVVWGVRGKRVDLQVPGRR